MWGGSEGTKQVVVTFVFLTLACIVVLLRFVVRGLVVRNLSREDWLVGTAITFSVIYAALICVEVSYGQGLQDSKLSPNDLMMLRKTLWAAIPTYLVALYLTKLSILVQYNRIFQGSTIQRITLSMIVFLVLYSISTIIASFFLCTPVRLWWEQTDTPGQCMSRKAKWFTDASINVVTDLIILLLPMNPLRRLDLPRRQKLELMGVFGLGGVVCIVSMVRMKALLVIAESQDTAKDNGDAALLSSVEVSVGIICGSLPTLRSTAVSLIQRFWIRRPSCFRTGDGADYEKAGTINGEKRHAISGPQGGITRVVTIVTQDERCDSRKLSLFPSDKIWDGANISSWVSVDNTHDSPA